VTSPVLLLLADGADPTRFATAPTLAAAAEAAGWGFDCYHHRYRSGRHFGGGDPDAAPPGAAAGGLMAGARHLERAGLLAAGRHVVAVGDPASPLWPALATAGAEPLVRTVEPSELYRAVFERLGRPLPTTALVVDGHPQGARRVVTAPFLYPAFFGAQPVLGVDVLARGTGCDALEQLGVTRYRGLTVDPARLADFPREVDVDGPAVDDRDYQEVTAELAERHDGWGRGVLLGDPELVAAQLPRAVRLRLLPLYGRPQTAVISRCRPLIERATEPVYGRQYDDRDFFELARLGHGLQDVDPAPPFDAAGGIGSPAPTAGLSALPEPDDEQLRRWAREGRVLCTLLFWAGMIREVDCLPPVIDVVAATGLAAGLVLTEGSVADGTDRALDLLATPVEHGGVLGRLEVLVGSTGRGVAAESLLPAGSLTAPLTAARAAIRDRLGPALEPRGWWPLLDTSLVPHRDPPVAWRGGRPTLRFSPRQDVLGGEAASGPLTPPATGLDTRRLAGSALRRSGLIRLFEPRRPFDDRRPGVMSPTVVEEVAAAGFSYLWTKAAFGAPAVPARQDDVVALSFTAGAWDGWSPFYTVGSAADLARAERRLLRDGRPGWVASTIDTPLWAMSGEVLAHGHRLEEMAAFAVAGGRSGRLINTTPHVVARYARLLDDEGRLDGGEAAARRRM
jgi:hypothetical protein